MTFTIRTLDELAGYFAAKAREMNEISAKRTGLIKHNYAGQAHAYQDAAITIRMCKIADKSRSKKQPTPLAIIKGLNEEIEKQPPIPLLSFPSAAKQKCLRQVRPTSLRSTPSPSGSTEMSA
jgi:hypothetical protein